MLLDHPGVAEAAVVGVPDPIRDEAVKAFIVPVEGCTPSEESVDAFCRMISPAIFGPRELA